MNLDPIPEQTPDPPAEADESAALEPDPPPEASFPEAAFPEAAFPEAAPPEAAPAEPEPADEPQKAPPKAREPRPASRRKAARRGEPRALPPQHEAEMTSRIDTPPPELERRSTARPAEPAPFPRFHATAGDRLDPRLSGRVAQARLSLRNAYTPSQPVTDRRMFAGRSEVLTTLIGSIEDQRLHTVIYGERGIGKTSMLHMLAQAARDARYLTVYISCGAAADFEEVFRALAAEIPVLYHSDLGPTSPRAEQGGTFADLIPEGQTSPRTASDILAKVAGTRVLVLLDEFDRVERPEFRRAIAELIKDLSDRSVRVQLVIAGVAANLTELIEHIPSIQRNILALQAPKMTIDEIAELVRSGEDLTGMTFDQAAINFIAVAANGFPYLASLLSHHAAIAAVREDRLVVTADDVSAAIAEALSEFNGRLSRRSQFHISQVVRERFHLLMGALSGAALSSGGRFTADDIQALQPEIASKNQVIVENLAAAGVLIEAGEDEAGQYYRFQEESVVPSYLWLLSVQARFFASQTAASESAASDAHAAQDTSRIAKPD